MGRTRRLACVLTAAVVTAAGALTGAPPATAQDGAADAVRDLYLQHCAVCHGPQGEGTFRAPELTGTGAAATHFQVSTGRMPPDPSERGPTRTPPPDFSEEEIVALAEYVQSIAGGPGIPEVDTTAVDVSRGANLYLDNCAACHGSSGSGAILTRGNFAPGLGDLTAVQIAEAMITGPGEMPRFAGTFEEEDRDAIIAYVQELQEPQNRGGLPLGHLGPGLEAAIALIIGLPLLVLVTYWLGRSANERDLPTESAERDR